MTDADIERLRLQLNDRYYLAQAVDNIADMLTEPLTDNYPIPPLNEQEERLMNEGIYKREYRRAKYLQRKFKNGV